MGQTDLLHPFEQLTLAGLLKGGHGNGELLAPRETFLDLDIWWEALVNLLGPCLCFLFPTGEFLPSISVLREERLRT